ncbi:MAG: winged helix-turn-helix transcriptional regulator [Candidatus Micrarchaeales archaeon]|nr:winged helix-turn-helix transcriptional regulator [Candidatus Micrarchaeales archaeon]
MDFYSKTERIILGALSANSRLSVTELAKEAKCSRVTAIKNLKRLEERLNIRYTLEIDESKLAGCEKHILAIKFMKKPPLAVLKKLFKDDEYAEEVFLLDGSYDLFIFAWAGDSLSYIKWETYMASELSEFRPIIKSSELILDRFGFWPLNDSFVDELHESIKLDKTDKKILALLNGNSRMPISEIAEKAGVNKGTARYRLFRLMETGIVKRFTLAVQNPPKKCQLLHFINYTFSKGIGDRLVKIRERYMSLDDSDPQILTTMQVVAALGGSFRSFGMSISDTEEKATSNVIDLNRRVFQQDDPEITYARVTKVIKGLLPIRNLNIRENYIAVDWAHND